MLANAMKSDQRLRFVLSSGYNPPQFALDAAKEALDKVDCNQYSPTKVPTRGKDIPFKKKDVDCCIGPSSSEESYCYCVLEIVWSRT